jgi:hypothetical protein
MNGTLLMKMSAAAQGITLADRLADRHKMLLS